MYSTTSTPHRISKNSLVNDWSHGLLLRRNWLSFPTRAVLHDDGRRDDTLPPPPFPKTPRQMAVLTILSYFHFFRVFIKKIFGARATPPRTPVCMNRLSAYRTRTCTWCTWRRSLRWMHATQAHRPRGGCGMEQLVTMCPISTIAILTAAMAACTVRDTVWLFRVSGINFLVIVFIGRASWYWAFFSFTSFHSSQVIFCHHIYCLSLLYAFTTSKLTFSSSTIFLPVFSPFISDWFCRFLALSQQLALTTCVNNLTSCFRYYIIYV